MKPRVWLRRISAQFKDRLTIVPVMFVVAALILSQVTLAIDRDLSDDALPRILETTVDSASSILSTIAGGLISAITLLLSLVLLAVQLASSQFSPRTVQDWISDRTQQRTIGIVLATVVFCLMVLRETQTIGDSFTLAPHVSVLVAVALAVISLVAVVRSVDHLSNSMRVGSVARGLAQETLEALRKLDGELPIGSQPTPSTTTPSDRPPLTNGTPLTLDQTGWVQRVHLDLLIDRLEPGSQATLVVGPGAFVFPGQPLAWVDGQTEIGRDHIETIFEIGDTRLVGHDLTYGLLQMSDIALRALSPGINDPNTACDVAVHVGVVLLEAWGRPAGTSRLTVDDTTIDLVVESHEDYLDAAFSQVLRYAANEFEVLSTIKRTIQSVLSEVRRRDLPGPVEPLEQMLRTIDDLVHQSELSAHDKARLTERADHAQAGRG